MSFDPPRDVSREACHGDFRFSADIFVNETTTVKYRLMRSDHTHGPVRTVVVKKGSFGRSGERVTDTWVVDAPRGVPGFDGSEWVRILEPNPMDSKGAKFVLHCPSNIVFRHK